nr:MAG TPA: hypothetical protein [Caudoviricetes sp.]
MFLTKNSLLVMSISYLGLCLTLKQHLMLLLLTRTGSSIILCI